MIMPFHVTISILVQTQLSLKRKSQNEKSANVKMIIIFDRSQTSHFISAEKSCHLTKIAHVFEYYPLYVTALLKIETVNFVLPGISDIFAKHT